MTTPDHLLLVVPNPFVFINAKGLPDGFCFTDPAKGRRHQVVGGKLVKSVVAHEDAPQDPKDKRPDDVRDDRVKVNPHVTLAAHRVEKTEYHRTRVLCGDLIAADLDTWKKVGGKPKDFLQPAMVLAASRDQRVHEWLAEHDGEEPACAEFSIVQRGEGEGLTVDFVLPGADGAIEAGEVKEGRPVHVAAVFRASPPPKAPKETAKAPSAPAGKKHPAPPTA